MVLIRGQPRESKSALAAQIHQDDSQSIRYFCGQLWAKCGHGAEAAAATRFGRHRPVPGMLDTLAAGARPASPARRPRRPTSRRGNLAGLGSRLNLESPNRGAQDRVAADQLWSGPESRGAAVTTKGCRADRHAWRLSADDCRPVRHQPSASVAQYRRFCS